MVRNGKLRLKMLKHGSDTFQNAKNEDTKVEISLNMVQNGLKMIHIKFKSEPTMAKNCSKRSRNDSKLAQKWPKIGLKMIQKSIAQ